MTAATAERADLVDLEALAAAEPPPCQVVRITGCKCGCKSAERTCGRPSVAVATAQCPDCGPIRIWMCSDCVDLTAGSRPAYCTCGARVTLRVVSS